MNYLIVGVPILAHYSISDRFDFYGGVNIVWTNRMSQGIAATGPQYSILGVNPDKNILNWQFTQEALIGLNYTLSQRVMMDLNFAKSLKNIQGMGVEMEFSSPDQETIVVAGNFDHRWARVNLELVYRLNK